MGDLRVIAPGMLTTVQDRGRWGFQSRGVPVAGPMDPYAHRLANALVRNEGDEATLEVTLVGPEIEFGDDRVVAVTGAEFPLTVGGESRPMGTAFAVSRGARLRFGGRIRGARAYIGVEGGIAVPPLLGSRATHLLTAMGGLEGRALKAGDRLPVAPRHAQFHTGGSTDSADASRRAALTPAEAAAYVGATMLRVLPGPQHDYFSDDVLGLLQSRTYTITQRSDRVGYRLDGAPLGRAGRANMISDATPMGTIQIVPSGLPILLMADRLTTGGYPQVATVISADLPRAGQLAAGDTISFTVCSLAEAMAALIAQERTLLRFLGRESA